MDTQLYLSTGDGNEYLAQTDPLDSFDAVLDDVIDNDETLSYESVSEIRFTGDVEYTVTYEEESAATYCADDVYFTEEDGGTMPLDTSLVDNYLSNISFLDLTDYVTYNVTDEELPDYGLAEPDLVIEVDYTNTVDDSEVSGTFVLNVGSVKAETDAGEDTDGAETETDSADEAEDEDITAYVRVGESRIVYSISVSDYENLMAAGVNDLRHREVFTGDFDDITSMELTLEGVTYAITREEPEEESDGDGEYVYKYGDEEIDIADLRSALTALEADGADSFTDEEPDGREEISLVLTLDNENFPQVEITLYRYDGSFCIAEVDGAPVSLVERSQAVDLIEAVNAIVLN